MDVLEIRESLEILAIRLACERITPEQVKMLEEKEEEFRKSEGKTLTEIAEADVAFHEVIYTASGNRRLLSILNNLREQMYRFRLEYLKQMGSAEVVALEHDAIVSAIREDDCEKAISLMKDHIERQRNTIESALPG